MRPRNNTSPEAPAGRRLTWPGNRPPPYPVGGDDGCRPSRTLTLFQALRPGAPVSGRESGDLRVLNWGVGGGKLSLQLKTSPALVKF